MEQEIWQEDQPVLVDDLDRAQSTKEDAITKRLNDAFGFGVVSGSQQLAETVPFLITVVSATSINIGTGVAYDLNGQRIIIPGPSLVPYNIGNPLTQTDNGIGGTELTPISTGSSAISITPSAANYIYITYVNTIDPTIFTISEFNNSRLFVSGTDGYRIDVQSSLTAPFTASIFLGEVDASQTVTTTGQPVFNLKSNNLLATVPFSFNTLSALGQPYSPGQSVTFPYHVRGVGTGIITPVNVHGLSLADLTGSSSALPQLFMNSGITNAPQPNALGFTSSALYGVIQPGSGSPNPPGYGFDNFQILSLIGAETVLVNGITVSGATLTQSYYLFYFLSAAGIPLTAGTYTVYLNATTMQLLLAANGSPANTAYRVYGGTSGTFTNANTLPIATVLADPNNFVLWQIDWLAMSGAFQGIAFGSPIDLRLFGTIGSSSLQRDASTDTVTITHNVDIVADPNGVGVGNLTVAGTITGNLAGGAGGEIVYQSAPNVTSFTAVGVAGQVLTSTGAGTPIWTNDPSGALMATAAPWFATPTGSRTLSTAYFNGTSRTIFVAVYVFGGATNAGVDAFVNAGPTPTQLILVQQAPATPNPSLQHVTFLVPPGYSYMVASNDSPQVWTEWM